MLAMWACSTWTFYLLPGSYARLISQCKRPKEIHHHSLGHLWSVSRCTQGVLPIYQEDTMITCPENLVHASCSEWAFGEGSFKWVFSLPRLLLSIPLHSPSGPDSCCCAIGACQASGCCSSVSLFICLERASEQGGTRSAGVSNRSPSQV